MAAPMTKRHAAAPFDEDDSEVESLDALASARAEKQSPLSDDDEGDTDDAIDLPGAWARPPRAGRHAEYVPLSAL